MWSSALTAVYEGNVVDGRRAAVGGGPYGVFF